MRWQEAQNSLSRIHPPGVPGGWMRSEEHTSELQSHLNLVCRLLLEKKKNDCIALAKKRSIQHLPLQKARKAPQLSYDCEHRIGEVIMSMSDGEAMQDRVHNPG